MREERHKASAEQRSKVKRADADDDDIANWINKSRKIEQRKQLDDKQKAARMAKMFAEQVRKIQLSSFSSSNFMSRFASKRSSRESVGDIEG
jgi:hypothetical protein